MTDLIDIADQIASAEKFVRCAFLACEGMGDHDAVCDVLNAACDKLTAAREALAFVRVAPTQRDKTGDGL